MELKSLYSKILKLILKMPFVMKKWFGIFFLLYLIVFKKTLLDTLYCLGDNDFFAKFSFCSFSCGYINSSFDVFNWNLDVFLVLIFDFPR